MVERDLGRKPRRLRIRPDEDEQPARVDSGRLRRREVADVNRLERDAAVHSRHFGPEQRADVRPRRELIG